MVDKSKRRKIEGIFWLVFTLTLLVFHSKETWFGFKEISSLPELTVALASDFEYPPVGAACSKNAYVREMFKNRNGIFLSSVTTKANQQRKRNKVILYFHRFKASTENNKPN